MSSRLYQKCMGESERKKKDREKNEISVVYGIADLFYR